jgi:hypothetical protein
MECDTCFLFSLTGSSLKLVPSATQMTFNRCSGCNTFAADDELACCAVPAKEFPCSLCWCLQGEGRQVVPFKGKLDDKDELSKFVMIESLPLTLPFNNANTERIFGSKISRHMILIAKANDLKPDAKLYKQFAEAAKRSRPDRNFVFVTADISDEEGEPVIEFFGVKKEKVPMVIAFQVEPMQLKWWCAPPLDTWAPSQCLSVAHL